MSRASPEVARLSSSSGAAVITSGANGVLHRSARPGTITFVIVHLIQIITSRLGRDAQSVASMDDRSPGILDTRVCRLRVKPDLSIGATPEDRRSFSNRSSGRDARAAQLSNCKFLLGFLHLGSEFNQFAKLSFKGSGKLQCSELNVVQYNFWRLMTHLHEPKGLVETGS